VIAALGKRLPACEVNVSRLSLVAQNGAEDLWDWHIAGSVTCPRMLADRRTSANRGGGVRDAEVWGCGS
jgi:hypothetical protein